MVALTGPPASAVRSAAPSSKLTSTFTDSVIRWIIGPRIAALAIARPRVLTAVHGEGAPVA